MHCVNGATVLKTKWNEKRRTAMKRNALIVSAMLIWGIGCAEGPGADTQADDNTDQADVEQADSAPVPGEGTLLHVTWEPRRGAASTLEQLVIERGDTASTGPMHMRITVLCVAAPCDGEQIDGTYRLTRTSSGARYIRLYDQ